jgi:acetyltransferase-like isoleucine patch superfamily enzyme
VNPTVPPRTLAAFLYRYSSFTKILRAFRYPGIRIAGGVRLDIPGHFSYGLGCTIGVGSNIIVRPESTLKLGSNCSIGRYVELGPDRRIEIGSETSVQDRSIILGDVTFGRYCSLAPNVNISSGRHWFDLRPHELIKDQDRLVLADETLLNQRSKPVTVEDDCWLGINTVVMPGVTIGKGAVVGANSVVTGDIEPYTVMAGAPAKLLRRRLDFMPPQQIVFSNPYDRPYFYGGFHISQESLSAGIPAGGIAAMGDFVIALNRAAGESLHLTIRATDARAATLTFGGQRADFSNAFSEVVFGLHECRANRMRFSAHAELGPANILLKKAWID